MIMIIMMMMMLMIMIMDDAAHAADHCDYGHNDHGADDQYDYDVC